jgi:putative flippase GtrA
MSRFFQGSLMWRQFWRYCAVGVVAAALHFAVLVVLVELFAAVPTFASATGFCAAVLLNYWLQYRWTFRADGSHGIMFPLFALIAVLALGVNTVVFWACNVVATLPYLLAQVIATGTVVVVNFYLNRRFVFVAEPATQ